MRKLRSLPKSAVLGIEHLLGRFQNRGNHRRGNTTATACKGLRLRDCALDHLGLLDDIAVLFLVSIGDAEQYTPEAWTAVAIVRGEVRAAVKRLAVGSEKRGQRS